MLSRYFQIFIFFWKNAMKVSQRVISTVHIYIYIFITQSTVLSVIFFKNTDFEIYFRQEIEKI